MVSSNRRLDRPLPMPRQSHPLSAFRTSRLETEPPVTCLSTGSQALETPAGVPYLATRKCQNQQDVEPLTARVEHPVVSSERSEGND
jgi:hypothetical protein